MEREPHHAQGAHQVTATGEDGVKPGVQAGSFWMHGCYMCMQVEFPLALDSPNATYEVQWGALERPTHGNTSWDWARFEVVGHK